MTYQQTEPESKLLRTATMFAAAAYAITTQPQQYSMDVVGLATTFCYALEADAARRVCMYLGREIGEQFKPLDRQKPHRDFSSLIGYAICGLTLVTPLPKILRDFNGNIVRSGISWGWDKVVDAYDSVSYGGRRNHHYNP